MKLLHIDSSILGDASASRSLSASVVSRLQALHPDLEITYRDLAADPLPHVSLAGLGSEAGQAVLAEFLAADIVVLGAPMYNLTISSHLKAWIDHIVIAGRTFQYGADGVAGLAGDKRVIIAHSRGGLYSAGAPGEASEFAERYLRAILGFIGITTPEVIVAEGLAFGDEPRQAALTAAEARIAALDSLPQAA